jgi:hypothetical protein
MVRISSLRASKRTVEQVIFGGDPTGTEIDGG